MAAKTPPTHFRDEEVLHKGQEPFLFSGSVSENLRFGRLEATSSLDNQTGLIIQAALAHLLQGRTAFVITHRLSTVANAGLIVVIREGWILERGTHRRLLSQGGLYADLYRVGFRDMDDHHSRRTRDR